MPEKIHCFCLFVINVIKMYLFCFILKLFRLLYRESEMCSLRRGKYCNEKSYKGVILEVILLFLWINRM